MTIRHLIIFREVADLGKMSLAAKKLYITQPSVSQAISELEEYYGIRLFERLSKKIYLTEHGKKLLGYARHITALYEEMEITIRGNSVAFPLRIGATVSVGTCVISGIIKKYNKQLPGSVVNILVDNTHSIEDRILKSELDAAVVEGRVKSGDISVKPIIQDRLILICSQQHPLSNAITVHLSDLSGQPFILREPGSGTREMFEEKMKLNGLSFIESWTCNNSEAIKNAVADGHGISLISEKLVEAELKSGRLIQVPIEGESFNRYFSIIYHKNKYMSESLRIFTDICFEYGAETE